VSNWATTRAAARICAATWRPTWRARRGPNIRWNSGANWRQRHGNYDRGALLRADLWTYLSENCLAKTDRASMAHGLEVRVPLLANALQDRMLRLPAGVHFDAGGGKAILRALARKHLPDAVWNREKHGFSVPLRSQLRRPLARLVRRPGRGH
jgi:asparagine synthetase B (glutamine-hydrolysing)